MGTIVKLDTIFNADNLPVLTPLVQNGLVACYRPAKGLFDLSGNHHQLKVIGNPTITQYGALVDGKNYYETDIKETPELTYIAVYRSIIADDKQPSYVVGIYEGNRASLLFQTQNTKVDIGSYAAKKNNQGTMGVGALYTTIQSSLSPQTTDWVWHAMALGSPNLLTSFVRKNGTELRYDENRTPDYNYTVRDLSETNILIGSSVNASHGKTKMEIVEVLIYNKALTRQELDQQLKYTQEYCRTLGLNI